MIIGIGLIQLADVYIHVISNQLEVIREILNLIIVALR